MRMSPRPGFVFLSNSSFIGSTNVRRAGLFQARADEMGMAMHANVMRTEAFR